MLGAGGADCSRSLLSRIGEQLPGALAACDRVAITVAMRGGWVTLEGEVQCSYPKNGAEVVVRAVPRASGRGSKRHEARSEDSYLFALSAVLR